VDEATERRLSSLARRQRGYVQRQQLLDLGFGPEAIRYRARKGRLIAIYTGVYAVGHVPTSAPDRAYAALLACGPDAVLSHGSAASLWGIHRRWRTPFEVTTPTVRRRPGIRTHRAKLHRRDIRRHDGITVTSPARTILDVSPRLTDKALTRAVNDVHREPGCQLYSLHESGDIFVFVEQWTDADALKVHSTAPAVTTMFSAAGGHLVGAPDIKTLAPVVAGDPDKGQLRR